MQQIEAKLKTLVQLAIIDGQLDDTEKRMIVDFGKANNASEEVIQNIINAGLASRDAQESVVNIALLSFDEKFDYLYDIIQLMKIDGRVYLSEIKYCGRIAEKLGFDKSIVKKMSSNIYSDRNITVDRQKLKIQAKKYFN